MWMIRNPRRFQPRCASTGRTFAAIRQGRGKLLMRLFGREEVARA